MPDKSKKRYNPRKAEAVTVTIEGVSTGHRHLFNKICEEKRLDEIDVGRVFSWMVWKEACEVFGEEKAGKIKLNYYLGLD